MQYFSTCIVVNSDKYYGQSNNWKQDWWFCNNISYADVVKTKGKVVSSVQISKLNVPEVKDVKNNRNTITKRDYNVGKNIRVHCCKNIRPKQGQNVSKTSIPNKNINIARGKVTSDTKNHYSRSKVIEKPQITMAKDPDTINGQRCESENNSHALGNGIVQRCDFADNRQSRTSKHGDKTQGQANYTPSVKNRFWPLCTQESVNHSLHGHDYTLRPDVSDTKGDRKVSEPVKEVNKCQATVSKDTIKIPMMTMLTKIWRS